MRSFLIFIALVASCTREAAPGYIAFVSSCAKPPYMDLRHPFYLVTDQSFWSGCDKDPAGVEACHTFRVKQINDGIKQWFEYFDVATRPQAMVFDSEEEAPSGPVNSIIYLRIQAGFCGKDKIGESNAACYASGLTSKSDGPEIVFEKPLWITPRIMAHEFGHALSRDDNDVPEGTGSVMSHKIQTNVLPLDINMMCHLHCECQMVKRRSK